MDGTGPTVVSSFPSVFDAELAGMRLDSKGIDSFIANEHHRTFSPFSVIAFGGVKLMVDVRDESQARQIISDFETERYSSYRQIKDTCPACGSKSVLQPILPYWVLAILMVATFGLFGQFFRCTWECKDCGQEW